LTRPGLARGLGPELLRQADSFPFVVALLVSTNPLHVGEIRFNDWLSPCRAM